MSNIYLIIFLYSCIYSNFLLYLQEFFINNNIDMTYRELVYMIMDELKGSSDDFSFNEEHIRFLCSKYRAFLLKQRYYTDIKKDISEDNYQTICIDLMQVPAIDGEECEGGTLLKSRNKIPTTMGFGNTRVYPINFMQGDISFINRDRMKYVGYNKWLNNIIYCALGPDNYMYMKSWNPQFLYLEKIKMTGIFTDLEKAFEFKCNCEDSCSDECDIMDSTFPIEAALVTPLIDLVCKELRGAEYMPSDEKNDANDQLDTINVKTSK